MRKIKKIKEIPSKIKIVQEKTSSLEEEIQSEEDRQFSEFIETGEFSTPALETGQTQTPEEAISPPIRELQDTAPIPKEQESRVDVTKLYDIGKNLGGSAPKYTDVNSTIRQIRISPSLPENNINSRRADFQDKELSSIRGEQQAAPYDVKIQPAETRPKRRLPWET